MKHIISRIRSHRAGATAIEYALIASLISVAAIVSMESVGTEVNSLWDVVSSSLG